MPAHNELVLTSGEEMCAIWGIDAKNIFKPPEPEAEELEEALSEISLGSPAPVKMEIEEREPSLTAPAREKGEERTPVHDKKPNWYWVFLAVLDDEDQKTNTMVEYAKRPFEALTELNKHPTRSRKKTPSAKKHNWNLDVVVGPFTLPHAREFRDKWRTRRNLDSRRKNGYLYAKKHLEEEHCKLFPNQKFYYADARVAAPADVQPLEDLVESPMNMA